VTVIVVGGGQAGLAVSHELTQQGVEHVVLERGRIGQTWRGRWDSFCLVTPNWFVQLPGHPYDGDDPDGFMLRDELVAYFERYADAVDAPVREGIAVTSLRRTGGTFLLETSAGPIEAKTVVACTGAYQRPHRPPGAETLPSNLLQLDVEDYRNPGELPAGRVLVVGSGQSGCQIAEELELAGRDVVLACGRAPWLPRRIGGPDLAWWSNEIGHLDDTLESLPSPAERLTANVQASGRDGGHDLHYRTLQALGVTLVGHFLGADGGQARFAPDLGATVAWADDRQGKFMDRIRRFVGERGLPEPEVAPPAPFNPDAPERLDLGDLGAVIFAGGYRPNYGSWIRCEAAFDALGFPIHEEGASTAVPGLFFVGVHFLRKRKSSLLGGVGEDAAIVARRISEGQR
jgi:cation diffusion facilitator CzcD-associated flavoprotein CzcO